MVQKNVFRGLYRYRFAYDLLSKIKKDVTLLEVGAGYNRHVLSKILPKNIHYNSLDVTKDYGPQDYYADISKDSLPFEDNSFDILICMETLEHVPYPREAMKEFKRIIKDNGIIIISLPNEYNLYLRLAYLLGIKMHNTDSGFDVVLTKGHIHRPRVKDIKKFVSDYFNIRKVIYYWNSTKSFTSFFFYQIDKILNFISKIFPNLFSRGVIVVAINNKDSSIKHVL